MTPLLSVATVVVKYPSLYIPGNQGRNMAYNNNNYTLPSRLYQHPIFKTAQSYTQKSYLHWCTVLHLPLTLSLVGKHELVTTISLGLGSIPTVKPCHRVNVSFCYYSTETDKANREALDGSSNELGYFWNVEVFLIFRAALLTGCRCFAKLELSVPWGFVTVWIAVHQAIVIEHGCIRSSILLGFCCGKGKAFNC